ncbi:MAG: glycosyltransferase family 4 protein [Anaerolineae bacterium]|nr:glycosyltransferase family 4 protein [Anaerolineae bacterium]
MKVGIEVSAMNVNQAGTGIYVGQLLSALHKLEQPGAFSIQTFSSFLKRFMGNRKTFRTRLGTLYHDLAWNQLLLPINVARSDVDVFHLPANIGPVFCSRPTVASILDMSLFRYPDYFTPWHRRTSSVLIPITAKNAQVIITISEFSKSELVDVLGISPNKIEVTYLGASDIFGPTDPTIVEQTRRKFGLDQFMVVVCTLEPRKNIKRLVQAYSLLKARGITHTLVHIGAKGWYYDNVLTEIERLKITDSVQFLGYVSFEDLNALYSAASVAVYPSLYEGFGLPVLEAMQCGCPVVTSNAASLPEVVGTKGIMVDPYDVDALADAIYTVLTNPEQASTMRQNGFERAQLFSWEACAQKTIQAYKKALKD